jgi:hypothetical protein
MTERASSQRQEPVESSAVTSGYLDDLDPAGRAVYQRDRLRADAERESHCRERSGGRLAVDSTGADPDYERAVVFAAHTRTGRTGPDPDAEPHRPSLPARRLRAASSGLSERIAHFLS